MGKTFYSKIIANAVNNYLEKNVGCYTFDSENGLFSFTVRMGKKIRELHFVICVKEDDYIVYASSPLYYVEAGDEKTLAAMAEFICRANRGIKCGNFDLDMRDGEIRFKNYVSCDGMAPTDRMIKKSIYRIQAMYELYAEGIADIIVGNASPWKAVEKCENDTTKVLTALLYEQICEDKEEHIRTETMHSLNDIFSAAGSHVGIAEDMPEIKLDLFGKKGD